MQDDIVNGNIIINKMQTANPMPTLLGVSWVRWIFTEGIIVMAIYLLITGLTGRVAIVEMTLIKVEAYHLKQFEKLCNFSDI